MTETEENVTEEETTAVSEAAEATPEPEATAAEAPAEPEEQLSPKEARKRSRSTHSGDAAPERSIEERQQQRAERRARKAQQRRVYRQRVRERRASEPRAESPAPVEEKKGGTLKVRQGIVVSDKADKTIIVRIDVARRHRMYKKIVRTSSTLHAHDEGNEANLGDTVRVIESRPLSKTKRWRLVKVLERAR
jgi:small subunit ribosomal protein S17